jgi:hypothetical protein
VDLVLTWPKSRSLDSYLTELEKAVKEDKAICYRVTRLPRKAESGARVYMVHDGFVRGFSELIAAERVNHTIRNPHNGMMLAPGNYIVRRAEWHSMIRPVEMAGFQGFRYAPKWWRERGFVSLW